MTPLPPGAVPPKVVTPEMTAWAKEILHDGVHYSIGALAGPRAFGDEVLVARVEVHTWYGEDASKPAVPHRGVSLYVLTHGERRPFPVPAPVSVLGIDVSSFQPHVSWPAVAGAGFAFACAKATEGLTVSNELYAAQRDGARGAGMLVGAYHFFRSGTDPVAQARRFVEAAGDVDLPLELDVEDQKPPPGDVLGGLSPADFAEHVRACISEIAQISGRRPVMYVEPATWARLPTGQARDVAALADLWVASYNPTPRVPLGWTDWLFWQFTASGSVPGVGEHADVNRFAGTLDELRAYAAGKGAPARPPTASTLAGTLAFQRALNRLGASPPLVEDGLESPRTRAAVAAFQRAHGLVDDGIAGAATVRALVAALGS